MPRGRSSLQAPVAENVASIDVPAKPIRRSTRSSARILDASFSGNTDGPGDDHESATPPPVSRPRGRTTRASLAADDGGISGASTPVNASATKRPRGRPPRLPVAISEPVSSVQTPLDASSASGYSTPGTSIVPSPLAAEMTTLLGHQQPGNSIEVQLPSRSTQKKTSNEDRERDLRKSMYSLHPPSKSKGLSEVGDSDEEDEDEEFNDISRDAKVARRLQGEEYSLVDKVVEVLFQGEESGLLDKAVETLLPTPRRGNRSSNVLATSLSAPPPTKPTPKRARAATVSTTLSSRPAKRGKVVPDSDAPPTSDLDMDAEIAAGVAVDTDDALSDSFVSNAPEAVVSDSDDSDLSSLSQFEHKEIMPKRKRPGRTMVKPSKKSVHAAVQDNPDEVAWVHEDITPDIPNSDSESGLYSSDDELNSLENVRRIGAERRGYRRGGNQRRTNTERNRLEKNHPELLTMWDELKSKTVIDAGRAPQPHNISRQLKPFQLDGLAWMKAMEKTEWKGGLLGDEMGLGKTIQAVSLIMSDFPAKQPTLVLVPPVALMQWQSEIKSYTEGTLETFVFHGTNQKAKGITVKELKKYNVIMMSYNSLESMYRKQEKGFKRKDGIYKEKSVIHSIKFHRIILDEAHCIKTRTTMTAKACFALQTEYRWCLSGTPLQNRIGELFSLIRFLNMRPFASYLCKQCPCTTIEWSMDVHSRCTQCHHAGMQHVSLFNQQLLNPIQKFGNKGPGKEAFQKMRLMTERIMLRRLKKDHTDSMELPVKEVYVDRQFFGEEENDFANSIMTNGQRNFDTYVAQGVLLNNYANIFGLIMQMRQVADHPDLILKKHSEGGQNMLVCCICDEPAEDTIRSQCKHDFCRACVSSYIRSANEPDCPRCHIPLSIDLEQPEMEQDESFVKKSSIINRIKMENWTSSSKIELLVHELHKLRSNNASHKSIIFSQFTTMLQLIEWRLRRAGITTVMLDGTMTPAQRQASIEHFMNNVHVECFLVSLKAGGVALNLTEASRVFIVDPWWNPAAEWQSADRCHRIGQTRPCVITRLCIEDSVESRMVLIQEKKTSMINSTVNSNDAAMETLSPEDMQFLFRGT